MIRLHYYPSNASMAPHLLLEELGVPFELALVDRERDAHHSPAYLRLNPNGSIPVLEDDDLVLYETAAICLHLADRHAPPGFVPGVGTAERAHLYKWLVWLTNTLQATLMIYFYPERWLDDGNAAGVEQVKAHAEAKVGGMLDQLDAQLASHGGPWLLGDHLGTADPYAFMLCRWTRGFARPARTLAHLGPYLERMAARPAVARVMATEGVALPWF